jgi:acyl-coenzyme A synthetase/AMP-(fatty) acid ligase
MSADIIGERLRRLGDRTAIVWRDEPVSYADLLEAIAAARDLLTAEGVRAGSVVVLLGDFTPNAIATELALFELGCALVPLRSQDETRHDELCELSEAEWVVAAGGDGSTVVRRTGVRAQSQLYRDLAEAGSPGLVLFSSGTSGVPKAALHDADQLLSKFERPARPVSMLAFLLFDHVGGINTMLHSLLNGGCLVTVPSLTPDSVGAAIEEHRVELLPTSPTFLNMFLLSRVDERYDVSSLQVVSYGSEPMPELTLKTMRTRMPQVKLHQTYGMTEIGIPVSKSRSSDSLWMKFVGDNCEYRVRDGMLEVRTATAMLGYLNAPSPFTPDGWMVTGDEVDVDGEWFHVRSRRSELINVGGQKVFPVEVESVLEEMDGVEEAVVSAEPSPLTGHLVCATVRLAEDEPLPEFRKRLRRYCRERLPRYMIPQKVLISEKSLQSDRHKKQRTPSAGTRPAE